MVQTTQSNAGAVQPAVHQPQVLIVTGYSGAGKSSVLRALEDVGFACVDNLPIALLAPFFQLVLQAKTPSNKVALGLDVRSGTTMEQLATELAKVDADWKRFVKIFFLTSSPQVLLKRFQETRRKHPLADTIAIADAIDQEKHLMEPFKITADFLLDTDQLTIHQLRSFIRHSFAVQQSQKMVVNLISFGFKYGVPLESNFIYDVSSLPNPYFVPGLRPLTGVDKQVQEYLFHQMEVMEYWNKCIDFIRYAIEKSYQEGRFFITIAIGCTGGRHRSVAFVQRLAQELFEHAHIVVKHRDVGNDAEQYGGVQTKES